MCGGLGKKKKKRQETENVKRVIIDGSRQKEGAEPAEAGVPSTALESAAFIVAPQTFSSQVSRRRQPPDARRQTRRLLHPPGSKRRRCFWAERNATPASQNKRAKKQRKSIFSHAAKNRRPASPSPSSAEASPPASCITWVSLASSASSRSRRRLSFLFLAAYLRTRRHAVQRTEGGGVRGWGGGKREWKGGGRRRRCWKAHKDKNHISLEGACVTVIYAAGVLPPH